jgi:hypothetical protein
MIPFVLFLAIVVGVKGQGFTIQSTFVNTYLAPSQTPGIVNQTVTWQQNTVTLVCTDGNFFDNSLQIQSPNGTISYYAIECVPPKYSFDTTLVGFVPKSGTLYTTQVCQVNSLSAYNGQNFSNFNPSFFSSQSFIKSGFNLMGQHPASSFSARARGVHLSSKRPGTPKTRFSKMSMEDRMSVHEKTFETESFFDNLIGSAGVSYLTGAACTASLGMVASMGVNCNPNNNNLPTAQWIAQLNALNNFTKAQNTWDQDTDAALSAQTNVNSQVQSVLTNLNTKVNALGNFTSTLNQTVYALAVHDTAQFAAVNSNLQTIYAGIALFGKNQAQTDANVVILQAFMVSSFQGVLNTTNKIQANSAATQLATTTKFNSLNQLVKQLAVSVSQSFLLTSVKTSITTGIYAQQAIATAKGEVFYVDPTQPGVAPATNFPSSLLQITWDIQYVNYIVRSGSVNLAHQYGWTFFCNADKYQNLGYQAIDYLDVPTLIGPANCTDNGGAVGRCLCWIQISHKICQAPNTNFRWQSITSNSRSAYSLASNGVMCNGGAVSAGVNDGLLISTINPYYSALGSLCSTALQGSFQFLSYRMGFFPSISATPPSWYTPVCGMDLTNIFETTQYANSLPYTVITELALAYQSMAFDANAVLQFQQGLQPSFITYTYLPFETLPDNNTYSCYRASIMGVSTETKPVFVVNPTIGQPLITQVTSTAYDRPPTNCIGTQCDFGNVVSVQQTNSIQLTNNLEEILPSANEVIFDVIQPLGATPPTTAVYNAPGGLATSGPLQAAIGQPTYMLQLVPPGFILANVNPLDIYNNPWPPTAMLGTANAGGYNPRITSTYFNHENAAYTIDQTLSPVDDIEQCVLPDGQTSQFICTLLDFYSVDPLTNFLQGKFVIVPDTWSYTVTLDINMGEIVQRVYPGCPELSFQPYGPNQISYVLTNSLPTTVSAVVVLTSSSGLCASDSSTPFDLQPKQIFVRNLPTCGSQTIQIFQDSSVLGLQSCGAAIPFQVNSTSQTVLQGPDAYYNQTFIQAQYITQTTGVILGAVTLMQTIIPYLDPATFNLTQQQRFAAINSSLIAFINLALQLSTQQLLGNTSAVDIYNQYAPQLATYAAAYQSANLQVTSSLTALNTSIVDFHAKVAVVTAQTAEVNRTAQALIAADNALIAAIEKINNANAGGYTCVGCPDIPLIYQLCCAVDNFGQFLANILLYAAIISVVLGLAYLLWRVIKNAQEKQKEDNLAAEKEKDREDAYSDKKALLGPPAPPPVIVGGGFRSRPPETTMQMSQRSSSVRSYTVH